MKTLSIVSHKGGAGKTSSAVMLAEELAGRGVRTVLIDADRQRGAGLLLGLDPQGGTVQQTANPRLRYLCSSSLPLRELPAKAEELRGLFDAAVVDTPSLDDPLARAWIQLSTDVLVVLPVEPVSMKTLDGVDAALEGIRRLNEKIQLVGLLPTMFNESDSTQRSLLLELRSRRPDGLLAPIPFDPGVAHRAEQSAERRTQPAPETVRAYACVVDGLSAALEMEAPRAPSVPDPWARARQAPGARAAGDAAPAVGPGGPPAPQGRRQSWLGWAAVAAALLLLALGLGRFLISSRADAGPAGSPGGRALSAVSSAPRGER